MFYPAEYRKPDPTIRLEKYFLANDGWLHRDRIMHWTGFPSPKAQPICAYAEFHNALDRLNRRIARMSYKIVGGAHTRECYRLERVVE